MSHERVGSKRTVAYSMPSLPSDALRSLEFANFFQQYRGMPFAVRTADGWQWRSSQVRPAVFTATFRSRERLDAVINDSTEANLGRAFLNGELDAQGDFSALLAIAEYVFRRSGRLAGGWGSMIARASLDLSQRVRSVRRHSGVKSWRSPACPWELPVQFFRHWLGPCLSHSCAQFGGPEESLEIAQNNALDRVCQLLEMEWGDRFLDISCGWGSLLLHSAANYRVDAQGIASSEEQAATTTSRIHQHNLERQCSVMCRDLRTTPLRPETFDKIADIGLFEQVGFRSLRDYFLCARRTLSPGGLFLLHRMVRPTEMPSHKSTWLNADLFPNGEPGSLSKELEAAASAGLEMRSVENVRENYEQTLRVWISMLQRDPECHASHASARGYRRWLLYLLEVLTSFQAGDLEVYQILLRRPSESVSSTGMRQSLPARRWWEMSN